MYSVLLKCDRENLHSNGRGIIIIISYLATAINENIMTLTCGLTCGMHTSTSLQVPGTTHESTKVKLL